MPRVLIASDDYNSAMDLRAGLEAAGLEIVAVETTYRSSVAAAENDRPTLAIVNSMLRSGPANSLAEKLSSMGIGLVVTTGTGLQFQSLALDGPIRYLKKPVSAKQAAAALKRLVHSPRSRSQAEGDIVKEEQLVSQYYR